MFEIYDGPDPMQHRMFGRYCGDQIPDSITSTGTVCFFKSTLFFFFNEVANILITYSISGSEILLILHTDDSEEEKGFVAEYREAPRGHIRPAPRPLQRISQKEPLNFWIICS